jgi:hypothetical protein
MEVQDAAQLTVAPRRRTVEVPATQTSARALETSVEGLCYSAVLVAALIARLIALPAGPLPPESAAAAMAAWSAANGVGEPQIQTSPLMFHLMRAAFMLGGPGEGPARAPALLAGVLMVVCAWAMRSWLGRWQALFAAAVFGLSPVWISAARLGSPDSLSALAGLTLFASVLGWLHTGSRSAFLAAAAAAAIGLATGPGIVTLALAGITFLAAHSLALSGLGGRSERRRRRRVEAPQVSAEEPDETAGLSVGQAGLHEAGEQEAATGRAGVGDARVARTPAPTTRGLETGLLPEGGVLFGMVLALAASGLLSRLDGVGVAVNHTGEWFARLAGGMPGLSPTYALANLLVYAPVVSVFGLLGGAAVIVGSDDNQPGALAGIFLAYWAALALLVGVISPQPATVFEAALPISLLAAIGLSRLMALLVEGFRWEDEGAMVGILLAVVGFGATYAVRAVESPAPGITARLGGAVAVLMILGVIFALAWNVRTAVRSLGLAMVIVLAMLGWHNGTWLNYRAQPHPREYLMPTYTSIDVHNIVNDLQQVSMERTGDPYQLPIQVEPELRNALAWSLRQWPVSFQGPDESNQPGAIIRASGAPFTLSGYMGQTYSLGGRWTPGFAAPSQWLRWYLIRHHEAGASAVPNRITIYVPSAADR